MPQICEVAPKDFETFLKQWPDIFDEKDKLKCRTDRIWKEIKEALKLKMEAKSIFHNVYNDRHHCFENLVKHFGIPLPKKRKRKCDDPLYDPLPDDRLAPEGCPNLEMIINCPRKNIICEKGKALTKIWSDCVAHEIVTLKNLPCKFNFKTSWFTVDSLKFRGYCSIEKCKCPIDGVCENLEEESLIIKINTFDCSSIKHYKCKRNLRNENRENAANRLVYQTAAEYREEEMAKLKTDVKREPAAGGS